MNERILRVLEFKKITESLSAHAATSLGKGLVSQLKPATDLNHVIELQDETDEATQIIRLNKAIPLGGLQIFVPA